MKIISITPGSIVSTAIWRLADNIASNITSKLPKRSDKANDKNWVTPKPRLSSSTMLETRILY